eukprot:7390416-Prymnesium_polylepis.1
MRYDSGTIATGVTIATVPRSRSLGRRRHLLSPTWQVPVTIAIEHADGTPVCARELYIGKKLDILGRRAPL